MVLFSSTMAMEKPTNELITPRLLDACRKLGLRAPEYPDEPDIVVGYNPITLDVEEVEIDPGYTRIYVEFYTGEDWWWFHYFLDLVPTVIGHYEIDIWLHVHNPSNKWAYTLQEPSLYGIPYDIIDPETAELDCVPLKSRCEWDSYCEYNKLIWTTFDIVKEEGYVACEIFGNQLRTDIDNDGEVNIIDIAAVAVHYQEIVIEDTLVPYNIVIDDKIDMYDLNAVAMEFGRQIPP